MELKNKVENIVGSIVNDARSKWSSHEEESDGINDYTNELVKLILLDSSLQLKENKRTDFDIWILKNRYMLVSGIYISIQGWEKSRDQLWLEYIEEEKANL